MEFFNFSQIHIVQFNPHPRRIYSIFFIFVLFHARFIIIMRFFLMSQIINFSQISYVRVQRPLPCQLVQCHCGVSRTHGGEPQGRGTLVWHWTICTWDGSRAWFQSTNLWWALTSLHNSSTAGIGDKLHLTWTRASVRSILMAISSLV